MEFYHAHAHIAYALVYKHPRAGIHKNALLQLINNREFNPRTIITKAPYAPLCVQCYAYPDFHLFNSFCATVKSRIRICSYIMYYITPKNICQRFAQFFIPNPSFFTLFAHFFLIYYPFLQKMEYHSFFYAHLSLKSLCKFDTAPKKRTPKRCSLFCE